jgi:hypothetical protein
MPSVAWVLVGLAAANAVSNEGERNHDQHDGETLDDTKAHVAHASSFRPFSFTIVATCACNASMASTRVAPHLQPADAFDLTRRVPAPGEAVLHDANPTHVRCLHEALISNTGTPLITWARAPSAAEIPHACLTAYTCLPSYPACPSAIHTASPKVSVRSSR